MSDTDLAKVIGRQLVCWTNRVKPFPLRLEGSLDILSRYTYNVHMISFEWDSDKNNANIKKHGVSFKEAVTAFTDGFARVIPDPDHSDIEDRFILLGMSTSLKLLVVCHCFREKSEVIRLISARKANKSETKQYGGFR